MKSKPLWLSRLNVRLAIMSTALILSAFTTFTYFSVEKEVEILSAELNKQAVALAENIAASTASYIVVKDYTSLESILIRSAEFPSVIDLQVLSDDGHTLGDVYKDDTGEVVTRYSMNYQVPNGESARKIIIGKMNMVVWQPVELGDVVGWVRTNHTLTRISEVRQEAWTHNLLIGVIVTLVAILAMLLYLHKPMNLIKQSAEFADGLDVHAGENLDVRNSFYEIDRLAAALNRTSMNLKAKNDALNDQIEAQRKFTEELERRVLERTEELSIVRDEAVEANKSKSEFLANMSHEIRTPLTAIIGFSESLLDSDQNMHERVDSINRIIRAGRHLLRIINEILDLSKIEAKKIEVEKISVPILDVFQDIHSLVSLLAEEKGLSFSIECDFPIPETIQTDPVRLKQILINLCNNAVKFTGKGGIKLKVSCDEVDEILTFKVIDTGIGLSEKQINKLFKPFSQADSSTTRQYGGTGLGLHLSKQFAEKLGGDLQVESLVDVGSNFILTISTGALASVTRLHQCPDFGRIELPKITERSRINLHGTVLLTEDNIDNQRLVSLYLRRLGLAIEIANNGREALEKADEIQPDLILMDIQMPIMDGLSATKRLREREYRGPIVALTANAMKQEQQECFTAGCNDVCTKPIDQEELIAVLSKYLTPATPDESIGPPISSALLDEDSELLDLVMQFVAQLPAMTAEIIAAFEQNDLEHLKSSVHALKGASGNYGYKELFEMMKRIEFLIVTNNIDAIGELLGSLPEMLERIKKGLDSESFPGGSNISPFPRNR